MPNRFATMSPAEFTSEAHRLLAEALRICAACPDGDLEEWMVVAKAKGLTWIEALDFVIRSMPVRT